jgi:lipopolysaccharide export system protein LptA
LSQAPKTTTTTADDSSRVVEILPGVRKLELLKTDDSTSLQILAGNVKLKQGTTYFYCDSCVINNRTKIFEAFGKVHINDSDTAHVYSEYLRYFQDKRIAYLKGGVKLTDGKGVLTTPELEYDLNTKIGIYTKGGKVVNKKTILTSQEGYYYADLKDVYFKKDVDMKDPAYSIKTDSLLYNTETETARFIAYTLIKDSSGRTVETNTGFYDLKRKKAEFGGNAKIVDGKTIMSAQSFAFDDSTGISQARGNVVIIDTVEKTTVIAGEVYRNNKLETMLATKKPLMIIRQNKDSIFITADTIFSARLSDLYVKKDTVANDSLSIKSSNDSLVKNDSVKTVKAIDTVKKEAVIDDSLNTKQHTDSLVKNDSLKILDPSDLVKKDTLKGTVIMDLNKKDTTGKKDSTNRYIEAYRNVRIFSDSLQAVGDSMFYSLKDSTFRLFFDPVVWSKENQITGDTIYLLTKNKKPERLKVINNSMMVNKLDPEVFNQVRSNRMDGYFIDGNIDSVRAKGEAQCIYFIQDNDSAYSSINQSQSDLMDIYFRDKELNKIVFRSQVSGTIWPIRQKRPSEMRLPSFRWLDSRRPKSKTEMFE